MAHRSLVPVGLACAVCAAFLGLRALLPDAAPAHEHTDDACCSTATQQNLVAFQQAVNAERGRVHRVQPAAGGLGRVVAERWLLGLERAGDLEGVLADHGLALVRAQGSLACVHSSSALGALAQDPRVRYAEPDYVAQVASDPLWPKLAEVAERTGLEQAWARSRQGAGVLVAVLDTGVDAEHPELRDRLEPGVDFVNGAEPHDDNGHGTAMAGIVAGARDNGHGACGVAPLARILPLKVADANGRAAVSDVVAGLDAAVARGAQVINLSLGTRVDSAALREAVARAVAAGAVLVAAAGNDPVTDVTYPAAYPGVLAVTALGADGGLWASAAAGPDVDLAAPGGELVAPLPGGVFGHASGSSAASAWTAGVAALVLSAAPSSPAQVRGGLRASARPLESLAPLGDRLGWGAVHAADAVARATPAPALALQRARLTPRAPLVGQAARVRCRVENLGGVRGAATLELREGGRLLASTPLALEPEAEVELELAFTAPAGALDLELRLVGDVDAHRATRALRCVPSADPRVELALGATEVRPGADGVRAWVEVENVGNLPGGGEVLGLLGGAGEETGAEVRVLAPSLAPGERARVALQWEAPEVLPTAVQRVDLRVGEGDAALRQRVTHEFVYDARAELRGLYQQSNSVDVILDAPWRVGPRRGYVPVQVFVPSKGGVDGSISLRIQDLLIVQRASPTGNGTVIYEDTRGARPTTAPADLELINEIGQRKSGATFLDLFGEADLRANGRHEILRISRKALGVPDLPGQDLDVFLDVRLGWQQRRTLLGVVTIPRSGSHRSVLKVRFAADPLPQLPGENHYHDAHHHTIAEWHFGSDLDVFAPRKAYGGPMQMVFETAFCLGVIDQPTAGAAWGRVVTTDHNCFNNRTIPDPDGPEHRPPFGPQSAARNPGIGQHEAYRKLLGPSAGEEVTFRQNIPLPRISQIPNFLNSALNNVLPGLPMGGHMLLFHADHVEGPWHGGGWLRGPSSPSVDVELAPLLANLAQTPQATAPFAYAAHPFSGMGWGDQHLDRSLGLDPAQRTRDELHAATGEFVVKGLEFYNGRRTRSMPSGRIDFNDLNPWADPDFAGGRQDWDRTLWVDFTEFLRIQSQMIDYGFVSDPETRFVRKLYQAGGSDAHGDFNFNSSRQATILNLQGTFSVGNDVFYDVRTYCFGEGKPGATAEDRWMHAFADGNSLVTDGPLATFSLDAQGRFDSETLTWHDGVEASENADGQIGGDGPLDGGLTALVPRNSADPRYRYEYASAPEWGAVEALLLYKVEAGRPLPTQTNAHGDDAVIASGRLALGAEHQELEEGLDLSEEGAIQVPTALTLGAYTQGDPDQQALGDRGHRCWTNAIYAVPYDADVSVAAIDTQQRLIPAGALTVTFRFDVSMDPGTYTVELKALDAQGNSTPGSEPALMTLSAPAGWADRPGIKTSELTLTNPDPIPLTGATYPAAGETSFVVYWRDAPRDAAGNALNRIAVTFSASGGTSTVGGSSSSSGGCALVADDGGSAWWLLVALGGLLAVRRRRCA